MKCLKLPLTSILLAGALSLGAGTLQAASLTPAERADKVLQAAWWHDADTIAGLKLSSAQQKSMDAEVLNFFTKLTALRGAGKEDRSQYFKALEGGDLQTARKIAAKIAQRSSARELELRELKINILEKLSSEQLSSLIAKDPRLIRRQWFRLGNSDAPERARRARGTKRGRRSKAPAAGTN